MRNAYKHGSLTLDATSRVLVGPNPRRRGFLITAAENVIFSLAFGEVAVVTSSLTFGSLTFPSYAKWCTKQGDDFIKDEISGISAAGGIVRWVEIVEGESS